MTEKLCVSIITSLSFTRREKLKKKERKYINKQSTFLLGDKDRHLNGKGLITRMAKNIISRFSVYSQNHVTRSEWDSILKKPIQYIDLYCEATLRYNK